MHRPSDIDSQDDLNAAPALRHRLGCKAVTVPSSGNDWSGCAGAALGIGIDRVNRDSAGRMSPDSEIQPSHELALSWSTQDRRTSHRGGASTSARSRALAPDSENLTGTVEVCWGSWWHKTPLGGQSASFTQRALRSSRPPHPTSRGKFQTGMTETLWIPSQVPHPAPSLSPTPSHIWSA